MTSQTIQIGDGREATIAIDDDPSSDVIRLTIDGVTHALSSLGMLLIAMGGERAAVIVGQRARARSRSQDGWPASRRDAGRARPR